MNKIVTGIVIMAAAVLTACGGSDSPETDKTIMPAADSSNTGFKADPAAADAVTPQTVPAPGAGNVQTIPATKAATALPGAGLNPAHGEPGHRCDISVGAPLNSAPAATTAPATQPPVTTIATPPQTITAPSTTPASSNAKLNPAHGQPGHDCAIAVGAPLKG